MSFSSNSYITEIKTEVLALEERGNLLYVGTRDSIFYQGGGGQPSDYGIIENENFSGEIVSSTDLPNIDDKLLFHAVKKIRGTLNKNDKTIMKIDWDRRYQLMKSHTAEHIFFKSLSKFTDAKLIKISLDKTSSVFVDGNVDWDVIFKAEKLTNEIIAKDMRVKVRIYKKDKIQSVYGSKLRIKLDRIKDNNVRVVEIGDYDVAACSGLHVKRTAEIGHILVIKLRAGDKHTEIKFVVDDDCDRFISDYSDAMRVTSHILNTSAMKVPNAVKNLIRDNEELHKKIKSLSNNLVDFNRDGNLYWGLFEDIDQKILQRKASEILEKEEAIVIGAQSAGNVFVMSNILNAKDILIKILDKYGGKGGGRNDFASGYCENVKEMISNLKNDFTF